MAYEGTPISIPIKGIVRAGADTVVEDGAMNEVIGLEYKDGSYRPYAPNKCVKKLPLNSTIVKLHQTSFQDNIIAIKDGEPYWATKETYDNLTGEGDYNPIEGISNVTAVEMVGNVACFSTNKGIKYAIYNNGSYVRYGEMDELPYVSIFETNRESSSSKYEYSVATSRIEFPDKKTGLDTVLSMAKGMAESDGYFTGNIFVTAAWKLNTGAVFYAQVPKFISGSSKQGIAYLLTRPNIFVAREITTSTIPAAIRFDREFAFVNDGEYNAVALKRGLSIAFSGRSSVCNIDKNIIKSLCIYISPSIMEDKSVLSASGNTVIKYFDEDSIKKAIPDYTRFYKVAEYSIDEVESMLDKTTNIDLSGKTGDTLYTLETLANSFMNSSSFEGGSLFTYNGRLHVHNFMSGRELNNLHLCDFFEQKTPSPNIGSDKYCARYIITTYSNSGDIWQKSGISYAPYAPNEGTEGNANIYSSCLWLPISNISRINIKVWRNAPYQPYEPSEASGSLYEEVDYLLEDTVNLNGSIFVNLPVDEDVYEETHIRYATDKIKPHNVITNAAEVPPYEPTVFTKRNSTELRVSESGTPMSFLAKDSYLFGGDEIVGLSSFSSDMANFNFGMYQMIVFGKKGAYLMSTDTTGNAAYGSVTADYGNNICCNPNSICKLDGAVVFATERGLAVVTPKGTSEFATQLRGPVIQSVKEDRGKGYELARKMVNFVNTTKLYSAISYNDFVKDMCDNNTHIRYVYSKKKLIAYNPEWGYSYWIDIETQFATKLPLQIVLDNCDYPDYDFLCRYGTTGKFLACNFDYAFGASEFVVDTFFQSRPIKVSSNVLKSVYRVSVRGYFNNTYVREHGGDSSEDRWAELLVLGSLDGIHWQPIGIKEKKLSKDGFHDLDALTHRVSANYIMVLFSGSLSKESYIDGIELTVNDKYNIKLR